MQTLSLACGASKSLPSGRPLKCDFTVAWINSAVLALFSVTVGRICFVNGIANRYASFAHLRCASWCCGVPELEGRSV